MCTCKHTGMDGCKRVKERETERHRQTDRQTRLFDYKVAPCNKTLAEAQGPKPTARITQFTHSSTTQQTRNGKAQRSVWPTQSCLVQEAELGVKVEEVWELIVHRLHQEVHQCGLLVPGLGVHQLLTQTQVATMSTGG